MDERIRRSRKQEQSTAKSFGGTVNPRSGAGWKRKADVRGGERELIECKRTDAQQITLHKKDLKKLQRQAYAEGRVPIFEIQLGGDSFYVIPSGDFHEHYGA